MAITNTNAINQLVINFVGALATYNNYRCYNPHKYTPLINDLYLKTAVTRLILTSDCLGLDCTGVGDSGLTEIVQNIGNLP